MQNVVLSVAVSLDGYIARPDGAVDWLFMDPEIMPEMSKFFKTVGVVIMGRKTLDVALALGGGKMGMGKMPCYVFSRSQPQGKRAGVEYVRGSPAALVNELKQKLGKDIWLMGGGELAREFLRENLVDRIDLGLMPVLLGEGIPLFPSGFPEQHFTLASHHACKSGIVSLSYARSAAPSRAVKKTSKRARTRKGKR